MNVEKPSATSAASSQYTPEVLAGFVEAARRSAEEVVPLVMALVKPASVVDVGCALGVWLDVFREHGVEDFCGVDGDYVSRESLLIPRDRFVCRDLAAGICLDRRFDLAVSLEVAEHLPESSADSFVQSLVDLAPVVLFSAAIPHQSGTGHINEQWQEYWKERFEARGHVMVDALRRRIWSNTRVARWYQQNALLYVDATFLEGHETLRRERELTDDAFVNLVHPETYLKKAQPSLRKILRLLRSRLKKRLFGRRLGSDGN